MASQPILPELPVYIAAAFEKGKAPAGRSARSPRARWLKQETSTTTGKCFALPERKSHGCSVLRGKSSHGDSARCGDPDSLLPSLAQS